MKIVITGGPSSGKTALIEALIAKGHTGMHEVSRKLIRWGLENGYNDYFLEDPEGFSQKLWLGRVAQYESADKLLVEQPEKPVFMDRGIHDIVAYLRYQNQHHPQWEQALEKYAYDAVFLLPPWEAIYQKDTERFEDYETAQALYQQLKKIYTDSHYRVYEVPKDTIANRIDYLLNTLH